MTYQEDFISKIAPYAQQWCKTFGFGVPSAIIGQSCLESAYGRSKKAQVNNFFGLKYREGRITCNSGYIIDTSSEQLPDGTYITIKTKWYAFADMNTGVEGYFQFIDTGNYGPAKSQTTPEGYLQALKDCGYATSKNYVQNVMNVVNTYNLTQYDGGSMYTNSALATYVKISPNKSSPRNHAIDTITIHHMAGNLSVETCGNIFANPSRKASSNYGIGTDGRIALYVEEKDRAWTSGSSANDNRAITIEVANELCAPYWTISAAAMNSLIELCADICKRNGIKQLIWSDNKNDRINHVNGCNMTVHRDFQKTACPGDFLYGCMFNIAVAVNAMLNTPSQSGFILNGLDYSPVFNPDYYADKYADLEATFGHDANLLWNHFITCGMNEFRQASAEFNPESYRERYADLRKAFGDDLPMYYYHYVAFGKAEGRTAV